MSEWISVKDRLPIFADQYDLNSQEVLVYTDTKFQFVTHMKMKTFKDELTHPIWQYWGFFNCEITHWMPLPEPPKC